MILRELSSLDGDEDWVLLVDTSTHNGQLIAYNNETILFEKYWGKESKHDQVLNSHFALLKSKLNLNNLKKIICVYGPGSFTGLRVSAIFSKILSMSLGKIPIYGLSSFHIYGFGLVDLKTVSLGDDFKVFIPSIGNKRFVSHFKFNKETNIYHEEVDLSGSKEHDTSYNNSFIISDLDYSVFFRLRRKSLSKDSIVLPHIQKFSYLDFYPLFLRRSEAEEKLKI